MAEEFQESDVIFSAQTASLPAEHKFSEPKHKTRRAQTHQNSSPNEPSNNHNKDDKNRSSMTKKNSTILSNSLPVDIPETGLNYGDFDDFDEGSYDEDEIVPPHVIIGRRIEGRMAFSVCTGNGRTLKGRDLSRVRNSILRMTGFLEV